MIRSRNFVCLALKFILDSDYLCVFAACSEAEWNVLIDPYRVGLIHRELYLRCEDDSSVRLIWRHYSPETSSYKSLLLPRQYTINGSLNTHTHKHILYVCVHWADIQAQIKSLVNSYTNALYSHIYFSRCISTTIHLYFCFLSIFLSLCICPAFLVCIDWSVKTESSHYVLSSTSWNEPRNQGNSQYHACATEKSW